MDVRELVAHLGLEIDQGSFEKGKAAIEALHLSFKAFAVGASVAAAGALVYFTKETSEAADAAGKLAASTGLNNQFLQKLAYAADLADVSTEQLAVGLRHLAKSGVKDVQKEVLRLADQFQSLPDDGSKVALSMEKFGRAGAALIPLLNAGSKSIEELMQEAEDLGLVFSDEDSKAAEEFNDDTKRLSKSLTGLRNDIGRVLIPVLHRLVNGMRALMKEFRAALPALKTFIALVKLTAMIAIAGLTTALLANAAAVATAVSWYIALGIASIRSALSAAAAWASAALPFIVIAALITAVILLLEDLYQYLTGGQSLLGKILPSLDNFLSRFSVKSPGDPWWLKALKDTLYVIQEITPMLTDLQKTFSMNGPIGKAIRSQFENDWGVVANTAAGGYSQGADGKYYPSTPAGAGGAQSSMTVNSPITVNTTGGNPQEIAGHVSRVLDEQSKSWWRAAASGVE